MRGRSRRRWRGKPPNSIAGTLKLPTVEECPIKLSTVKAAWKQTLPEASSRVDASGSTFHATASTFRKVSPPSSRSRKMESPREEDFDLRPDWDNRSHVSFSKDNTVLPKLHRSYFDALPSITIRHGNYRQPQPHAGSHETFSAAAPEVHRKVIEQRLAVHKHEETTKVHWLKDDVAPEKNPYSDAENDDEGGCDRTRRPSDATVLPLLEDGPQDLDVGEVSESGGPSSTEHRVPVDMLFAAIQSRPRARTLSAGSEVTESEDRLGFMKNFANTHKGQRGDFRKVLSQGQGQEELSHFHKWCLKKFGSALAAWKQLDEDGGWTISKSEFQKGMKAMNYTGDSRMLWDALDRDHSGIISFTHFDPEGAFALAAFKRWAEIKFGSVKKACEQFDHDRRGTMSRDEFLRALIEHGFPAEGPLWSVLAFATNEVKSNARQNLTEISLRNIEVIDAVPCPEYLWVKPDEEGAHFFKQVLMTEYRGNGILAWRELDRDGKMRVNWYEFQEAFRRLSNRIKRKPQKYREEESLNSDEDDELGEGEQTRTLATRTLLHAATAPTWSLGAEKRRKPAFKNVESDPLSEYSAASIWRALDKDLSGWLSIREFDEDVFLLLSSFRGFIFGSYDTVAEAFKTLFRGKASISRKEFLSILRKYEFFSDHQLVTIFEGLDVNENKKIGLEDLRFFDRWRFEEDEHEELAWNTLQSVRRQISFVRTLAEDKEEEEKANIGIRPERPTDRRTHFRPTCVGKKESGGALKKGVTMPAFG